MMRKFCGGTHAVQAGSTVRAVTVRAVTVRAVTVRAVTSGTAQAAQAPDHRHRQHRRHRRKPQADRGRFYIKALPCQYFFFIIDRRLFAPKGIVNDAAPEQDSNVRGTVRAWAGEKVCCFDLRVFKNCP